jgi:hypothetical protein
MESSLDNYDKPPHGTITKGFIALLRSRDPQVRQVSFLVHVHYLDRRERSLNIQFVRANADVWWWQGYGGVNTALTHAVSFLLGCRGLDGEFASPVTLVTAVSAGDGAILESTSRTVLYRFDIRHFRIDHANARVLTSLAFDRPPAARATPAASVPPWILTLDGARAEMTTSISALPQDGRRKAVNTAEEFYALLNESSVALVQRLLVSVYGAQGQVAYHTATPSIIPRRPSNGRTANSWISFCDAGGLIAGQAGEWSFANGLWATMANQNYVTWFLHVGAEPVKISCYDIARGAYFDALMVRNRDADHVAHIEDVLRVQTNECFFDQFKPDRSCPRVDCAPTELRHRLVHAAAFAANHAIMQLFTYYVEEAVTHLYRDPLFRLAMGQHVTTNLCSGMQQLGDNL